MRVYSPYYTQFAAGTAVWQFRRAAIRYLNDYCRCRGVFIASDPSIMKAAGGGGGGWSAGDDDAL